MTAADAPARAPVVAATDVAFAYRASDGTSRRVLSSVTLDVAAGEFVALVGTNGAGKTTLLRLLAGTLPPAAGRITLGGRSIATMSRIDAARRVAYLPQSLELPDGFRVSELVEMGRAPHAQRLFGVTDGDRLAVERALRAAGASELAGRYPGELSGGERQRVLVAMALAQEPQLLLLDEPTLHLDLAHQLALLESVSRLQPARELAVVAVFHDLNLAASFAPRVAVLAEGRIAADGRPEEVLTPALVEEVFGVTVDEARTAEGARHLAVRRTRAVAG